jgi:hypothetical protein
VEGAEGGEEEVGVDRGRLLLLEEGEGSASLWGNQAGSVPNSGLGHGKFWERIRILGYEFPGFGSGSRLGSKSNPPTATFEKREYGNWYKISYRFSELHPLFS